MLPRIRIGRRILTLLVVVLVCVGCSSVPSMSYNPWEVISLPTDSKLFDIAFTDDPNHGFIVGNKATLLETQDGGESWNPIALQVGDENYRFNAIDFAGDEGWIAAEPSILLHTTDEGKTWSSIPLSDKLPGNPVRIVAFGDNKAEMATDVGAIYRTKDGGKNWIDYQAGLVFGWKINRSLGIFFEGEYTKFWDSKIYNSSVGLNITLR